MDEAAIIQYITDIFDGVETVTANGDTFFFYDPAHMLPFATLVTSDFNDTFSDLNRPSVFRLNIGVGRETYRSLFGSPPRSNAGDADNTDYDFTALDRIMPHPVYGKMYWVCVLNPSEATFRAVQPLLAEAYAMAVARQERHAGRTTG